MRLVARLSFLMLSMSSVSEAQHCLGLSSFAAGPVRVDAGLVFADDATTVAGGLAVGQPGGPFASAAVMRTNIDDGPGLGNESTSGVGLQAGWDVDMTDGARRRTAGAPRISLCPIVGFQRVSGEFGDGSTSIEVTGRALTAGLSLGAAFPASPRVAIVPFASLNYVNAKAEVEGAGEEFEGEDDNGRVDLGVGFVFNRSFTVRPLVLIPVGEDEGETSFGVTVHINFGSSRR